MRVTSEGIKLETVIHMYIYCEKGEDWKCVFENREGEQIISTHSFVIAGSIKEGYRSEGIRVIEHSGPPPTNDSGS